MPPARAPILLKDQPWPDDPTESARLVEEAFRPFDGTVTATGEEPVPTAPQTPAGPPTPTEAPDPYADVKALRKTFATPKAPAYKDLTPGQVDAAFRAFEPSFVKKAWSGVKGAVAALPGLLPSGGEPPFALDPSLERRKAQFAPLIERIA